MTDTQPLAPTDAEIIAELRPLYASDEAASMGAADDLRTARAVLARWGQPAHSGEPVAWLDPWTGSKVTTDYDAYGKHGIPLYTTQQPTQPQAGAVPMSHEDAKALVRKYGNDPLHLVLQVERHHGIKGGQHG